MFSIREPLRLSPPWANENGLPTFLVKPATFEERTLFEADLSGRWRAPRVMGWQLLAEMEEAIAAWTAEGSADRARLLEAIARARAGEADPADRALLESLEQQAIGGWPPYAALVEAQRRRAAVLPAFAVRTFLVGWEGRAQDFTARADGSADDPALASIADDEIRWLGHAIYRRLFLGEGEGNSSAPPPSSPPARKTSAAASGPKTAARAGKSTASSGRKTPG